MSLTMKVEAELPYFIKEGKNIFQVVKKSSIKNAVYLKFRVFILSG